MLLATFVLVTLLPLQAAPQKPTRPPSKAELKAADDEAARKLADDASAAEAAKRAAEESAQREAKQAEEARAAEEKALQARGLDARVRALCDLVALPLKRLPGDHRDQRFAVLPFTALGAEAEQRQLGVVVAELVLTNLARDHRLAIVERAALATILDEQALGQSGALANGQAAQVGKVSGARALVIGQVSDDGSAFRVTVRAIDTETAAVIEGTARTVLLPKDELVALSASAVVLRSKSGAMFRSMVMPGWGQVYNDEPVKAGVVAATTGTLAVATVAAAGIGAWVRFVMYDEIGKRPQDQALTPEELPALVVATREAGETTLALSAVLAGATVVAWSVGVIDAYLSGSDVESLDAALASN